jgi:hypothetical protein
LSVLFNFQTLRMFGSLHPVSVATKVFLSARVTGAVCSFFSVGRRGVPTLGAGTDKRGLLCRPVTRDADAP